tara:strand:- start:542 stop:763 length:222 start_codon:yes stop_codon:yes gene_type:complete
MQITRKSSDVSIIVTRNEAARLYTLLSAALSFHSETNSGETDAKAIAKFRDVLDDEIGLPAINDLANIVFTEM